MSLADDIIAAKPDEAGRIAELVKKLRQVVADVAAGSGISPDTLLAAVVADNQETQRIRGYARVRVEAALIEANAEFIASETDRLLLEESKK